MRLSWEDSFEVSWKEVKFIQVQLVVEGVYHKRCNCTNDLEKQDINLLIER
jgi:hypothetical protein